MSSILIDLGFIQIRWYSLLILISFILGYFLIINKSKKLGYETSKISDMIFNLIIISIIGARIYYCLFNMDYYSKNLLDIFKIWEGGLAIHGGIITGIIFIFFYYKKLDIPFIKVLDLFAPSLVLGQAIGRWGNFFNQEAFGLEVSQSFLEKIHLPNFIIENMYIESAYHHPTFLYESLGCLIIFALLIVLRNIKNTKPGIITSIYFILYGILRFFIEALRTDSLMFMNIKTAQAVSILMVLVGIFIFLKSIFRREYDK